MVGMVNATLYKISANTQGFYLNGFIELKDNYYYSSAPSVGDSEALYPWVSSDVNFEEWTWTTPDILLDSGYESSYHKEGNVGAILFHKDVNDTDRSGDGFLTAYSLNLSESNISFYDNDLVRIWDNPRYDIGAAGVFPDYEMTDTFSFDASSDVFPGELQFCNFSIALVIVPVPAAMPLFVTGLASIVGKGLDVKISMANLS